MYTPESVGTPLSDNATTVLLLGSGELGREVTFALQRLGVEVHAADRYEGAPAHHTANYAHVLDMTDGEQVRELVERVRPDFVVPEIESLATKELELSLIHISEPTRLSLVSRMPSSA